MIIRKLLLGVSLAAIGSVAASAADLIIPTTPQPIMESYGFDWEGLYVGARAGGFFADDIDAAGVIGAAVGVNFIPADPFLVGVEVTGDYVWGDDIVDQGQFFANLRAGAVVTDSVLVYALGGVGVATDGDDSVGLYQLGGGVEFAVTDAVSVRGEVVGVGSFDDADDDFFEAAKATVGVFYHF
ncbi:outer membrane protein [Devosia aurantiaca]|uniref:Outer membrane beta-barrel protein n=1 Tax=Devosia aurantiaca TaxID=2714858 RepID=A0A6M1SL36_9HYPH|nr:outer membrane beta-barrel protein [Devosia aurantiaca]NGP17514.1 outer membrane beta-barrel protein [Devosia aurantiaca]